MMTKLITATEFKSLWNNGKKTELRYISINGISHDETTRLHISESDDYQLDALINQYPIIWEATSLIADTDSTILDKSVAVRAMTEFVEEGQLVFKTWFMFKDLNSLMTARLIFGF